LIPRLFLSSLPTYFVINVMEKSFCSVYNEHCFRLMQKFFIRMGNARLVPERAQGIEDVRHGLYDPVNFVCAWACNGECRVVLAQQFEQLS
jgi:hypothetical protein